MDTTGVVTVLPSNDSGWAHNSLGGREEGTGVSTAPDLRLVGKNHKGRALIGY
jgi:hypothetical protein